MEEPVPEVQDSQEEDLPDGPVGGTGGPQQGLPDGPVGGTGGPNEDPETAEVLTETSVGPFLEENQPDGPVGGTGGHQDVPGGGEVQEIPQEVEPTKDHQDVSEIHGVQDAQEGPGGVQRSPEESQKTATNRADQSKCIPSSKTWNAKQMMEFMRQGQSKEEVILQKKKARIKARLLKAEEQLNGQLDVSQGVNLRQFKANWYTKFSDHRRYKEPVNAKKLTYNSNQDQREAVNPEEELVPATLEDKQGAPV